jgi:hypothetical protein
MPALLRLATERELGLLFVLSFFTGISGLVHHLILTVKFGKHLPDGYIAPSLGGLTLFLSVIMIWRILQRDHRPRGAKEADPSAPMVQIGCRSL